ncbi:conserved protein of unknown function [Cupriavidus taiwanensis]|nr:protein of unknown function [Cupriavidus taiwanensis]SOZ05784.1 hypothetical protein CBM2595_A80469 [Cupriavidus taiwanensis]SPD40471.1 conserved protein of unknown function [Cupriavidus taiwanensis]
MRRFSQQHFVGPMPRTPFPKYLFFCHNPGLPVIGKWFVRRRAMPSPLAENCGLQRTGYPTRKDSS